MLGNEEILGSLIIKAYFVYKYATFNGIAELDCSIRIAIQFGGLDRILDCQSSIVISIQIQNTVTE